jgi:hypothetical protein
VGASPIFPKHPLPGLVALVIFAANIACSVTPNPAHEDYESGQQFEKDGKYDKALMAYDFVVKRDPTSATGKAAQARITAVKTLVAERDKQAAQREKLLAQIKARKDAEFAQAVQAARSNTSVALVRGPSEIPGGCTGYEKIYVGDQGVP